MGSVVRCVERLGLCGVVVRSGVPLQIFRVVMVVWCVFGMIVCGALCNVCTVFFLACVIMTEHFRIGVGVHVPLGVVGILVSEKSGSDRIF